MRNKGKNIKFYTDMKKNVFIATLLLGFALTANTGCADSKTTSKKNGLESLDNLSELSNLSELAETNQVESGKLDKTAKKTFALKGFNKINAGGIVKVHFTQASDYEVKAVGTPKLMSAMTAYVEDETLNITLKKNVNTNGGNERVDFYVKAPDLTFVDIGGACSFTAGSIKTENFGYDLSGAVKCRIGKLKCKKADLEASGAVNVELIAEADELKMDNSGACKTNLKFKGGTLDIENSGAGNINAEVDCKVLKSDNSGASKVTYTGTADKTTIENSGVAKTNTKLLNNL